MFIPLPTVAIVCFARDGTVQLHPTLAAALQPRKGASTDFGDWMHEVFADWKDAKNLCAVWSPAATHLRNLCCLRSVEVNSVHFHVHVHAWVVAHSTLQHDMRCVVVWCFCTEDGFMTVRGYSCTP